VGPGLVVPDPGRSDEAFQKLAAATPLARGTTPEEIAAAVRFLIDSPSITGQMLALDAGFHMGWLHPGQQAGHD
jgi:NAD(P)-dependent dehydrogenase (short-subunit alcohol dehydrogenase family)